MPQPPSRSWHHTKHTWWLKVFAWSLHTGNRLMRKLSPDRKHELFQKLSGRVLEIGPGPGANMPLYSEDITLMAIEPNPFMFRYLRLEAQLAHRNIHLLNGRAEALCLADGSVDAIVCTHVLCSVDDADASLSEIMRVLKPGGLFIFLEHIAAPRGTPLRFFQRVLRPGWRTFGDGCRLDRELWRTLEYAGFAELTYEHFRVPWALPVSPHIIGWARKTPTP